MSGNRWQRIDYRPLNDDMAYGVFRLVGKQISTNREALSDGMAALRAIFPAGRCDEMNQVLFSTSGTHGSYTTIEQAQVAMIDGLKLESVTFLIIQPRLVCMRYGKCTPQNGADIEFLLMLRKSSRLALAKIG